MNKWLTEYLAVSPTVIVDEYSYGTLTVEDIKQIREHNKKVLERYNKKRLSNFQDGTWRD